MHENHQILIGVINRESTLSLKFTQVARESLLKGSFEKGTNSLRKAEEHHYYLMWLVDRLLELDQMTTSEGVHSAS